MSGWVAVCVGGGIGTGLRYGLARLIGDLLGETVWGILGVNLIGSLLMGLLTALMLTWVGISDTWRLFLLSGLLGGFTTFSAFSADTLRLFMQSWNLGLVYVAASVIGGVLLMLLGLVLGRLAFGG